MEEKKFLISDASKALGVESHVLRYWEDELGLEVPRNEMGHRCYSEDYINLLKKVKDLKEKGFQLKAIKALLPDLLAGKTVDEGAVAAALPETLAEARPIYNVDKMEQFQMLVGRAVARALEDMSINLGREISDVVSERTVREIRDYFHEEQGKAEAALSKETKSEKKKKKSKFFRKNRLPINF